MNLSDQVVSLELSKRLKELGIEQESLYSWFDTKRYGIIIENSNSAFDLEHYLSVQRIASAFTVAELGEMLPAYQNINGDRCLLRLDKFYRPGNSRIEYSCEYWILKDHHYSLGKGEYDVNEANARANMLIYLLENKLIELPK
jgi:hypothetical protein